MVRKYNGFVYNFMISSLFWSTNGHNFKISIFSRIFFSVIAKAYKHSNDKFNSTMGFQGHH